MKLGGIKSALVAAYFGTQFCAGISYAEISTVQKIDKRLARVLLAKAEPNATNTRNSTRSKHHKHSRTNHSQVSQQDEPTKTPDPYADFNLGMDQFVAFFQSNFGRGGRFAQLFMPRPTTSAPTPAVLDSHPDQQNISQISTEFNTTDESNSTDMLNSSKRVRHRHIRVVHNSTAGERISDMRNVSEEPIRRSSDYAYHSSSDYAYYTNPSVQQNYTSSYPVYESNENDSPENSTVYISSEEDASGNLTVYISSDEGSSENTTTYSSSEEDAYASDEFFGSEEANNSSVIIAD